MKWAFKVYMQYVRISFSSAAAYRANFFFTVVISFLSNMLIPLLTVLIYQNGYVIPGWSFYEAMLIQSVFMLCTGFCAPFIFNMVWITMDHIREGTYDLLTLKPGPPIFILAASSFDIENIGTFLGGVVMFVFTIHHLQKIPFMNWLKFTALFIMGITMTFGCVMTMSATTFKWVGNSRIYEIYNSVTMFGRYPASTFSKGTRIVITYIFPAAMLGFFPASALLGKSDPDAFIACIPCAVFAVFGVLLFKRMTYLYQSAGG